MQFQAERCTVWGFWEGAGVDAAGREWEWEWVACRFGAVEWGEWTWWRVMRGGGVGMDGGGGGGGRGLGLYMCD